MRKINFTKMVASGNDFVVLDSGKGSPGSLKSLSRKLCDRKYGVGADGLLILGKSRKADARMRVFNADGSEAEMCGNGARCAAYTIARERSGRNNPSGTAMTIETKAGIIASEVGDTGVRIRLTDPKGIKLNMPLRVNGRSLRVNFINTGVPHTVIFVEGLNNIDVEGIGRQVRFHSKFSPKGTNVNFVQLLGNKSISVRTYERGVEGETLACGTGSTASALILAASCKFLSSGGINVKTKGREILRVYFDRDKDGFRNVWLEGRAKIVYKGECYV
jgi:diaminopimelate epimerase